MTAQFKTIRIADASPVTWRKIKKSEGPGNIARLPCPRVTRLNSEPNVAYMTFPAELICAPKVNIFQDDLGRIAFQPDPRGDYKVSPENQSTRSKIGIPRPLRDLIPMGHTPVTLAYEGELLVMDLKAATEPTSISAI